LWRWVLRPLAWLVALLALAVLALQGVLHSLDRPWLKQRLLERARTSTGVDIDYGSARVDLLSGAVIEGLVVQSPAEVRPFAPELVRVGRVEAAW
jgi:translocation and assembly module TamB